ncbi:MAG: peptide-N-glycosidase F-related protein [Phycisphaerae bacterium]
MIFGLFSLILLSGCVPMKNDGVLWKRGEVDRSLYGNWVAAGDYFDELFNVSYTREDLIITPLGECSKLWESTVGAGQSVKARSIDLGSYKMLLIDGRTPQKENLTAMFLYKASESEIELHIATMPLIDKLREEFKPEFMAIDIGAADLPRLAKCLFTNINLFDRMLFKKAIGASDLLENQRLVIAERLETDEEFAFEFAPEAPQLMAVPESGELHVSFTADFSSGSDMGFLFHGAKAPKYVADSAPALPDSLGMALRLTEKNDRELKRSAVLVSSDNVILEKRPSEQRFEGKKKIDILLKEVCGARELTLTIDGLVHPFYNAFPVLGSTYPITAVSFSDGAAISDFQAESLAPAIEQKPCIEIKWKALGNWDEVSVTKRLPTLYNIGRVVLDWRLKPASDPWDRVSRLYVGDGEERFEFARIITSYNMAGGRWLFDVTPLATLLAGERTLTLKTRGEFGGEFVLRYYRGETDRIADKVVPLWNGEFLYGPPGTDGLAGVSPIDVGLPESAEAAKFYSVVTGHGWAGNKDNGAEFMKVWRRLKCGETETENYLWWADNNFNPIDYQGGTWFIDRAGWRPGCVVEPWIANVPLEQGAGSVNLEYIPQPYKAEFDPAAPNASYPAVHYMSSYLLVYE